MTLEHGTRSSYVAGCRCPECQAANTTGASEARARRQKIEPPEHGTDSSYINYKCRCPECRAAHTARMRDYRAGS